MLPTQLTIRGLKATDRNVALSKLNLCLGPVGSGKSTILDALRFLALGCVPHLGKNEAATARLMRDGEIEVTARLDDGSEMTRTLRRDGVRFIGTATASWLPPRTKATEASVEIRKLFGASDIEGAENLDLRALLAASPNERAKKIEALLDASGASIDEIVLRVDGLTVVRLTKFDVERLPEDTDGARKVIDGLRLTLTGPEARALPGVLDAVGTWLRAAGIPQTLERVADAKSRAADDERTKLAARKEIENRQRMLARPAERVEDLRQRRDEENRKLAGAERDLATARNNARARADAEAPIPALKTVLEEAQAAFDAAIARLEERPLLEAEIETIVDPDATPIPETAEPDEELLATAEQLEAEAAAITNPDPPTAPKVIAPDPGEISRAAALDQETDQLRADADRIRLPDLVPTVSEERAVAVAREALDRAKASPWREVEEIATRIDAGTNSEEFSRPIVDRLRALATTHGGDICAFGQALSNAEAALKWAQRRSDEVVKDLAHTRARIVELRDTATMKRTEAVEVRANAKIKAEAETKAERAAYEIARAEWQKAIGELDDQRAAIRRRAADARQTAIGQAQATNDFRRGTYEAAERDRAATVRRNAEAKADLRRRSEAIAAAARTAQTNLDKAKADLAEAEARLAGIAEVVLDTGDSEQTIETAKATIAELDTLIDQAAQADARKKEMDDLVAEIERATALVRCYDAVQWALHRCREEDLRRRSGGLEERMVRFLRAAGRSETPYLRVERGVTEFGWRRGAREIAVEALSGGENVTFTAALAAAVVAMRQPRIRCLLIEAAELGASEPALAVLRGCETVADDLDLILVATNADLDAGDAWTIHRSRPALVDAAETVS